MAAAITGSTTIGRNPSILFNDFDDGLMMMDIDSGNYFDIDSVGGRIWTLIETPTTVDRICESLLAEYEVEPDVCRTETIGFIEELADKGLVTLQES
ncbi:PqqD family peptide modification chaperone [Sphingopyxis sp. PET50]|uniref:PqqD family peptide modification chaperone n=1 Tax=Sphingopyxis sp. PET50 TaxID=2976533 RepID=UPI0021AEF9A7|nr:PqqD family peptide modification chaperone [Sphingopyxis sp. PET50]